MFFNFQKHGVIPDNMKDQMQVSIDHTADITLYRSFG